MDFAKNQMQKYGWKDGKYLLYIFKPNENSE